MIDFSNVFSVCDFFIVFSKILLCRYKRPVTQTDMNNRVFTLPFFHNYDIIYKETCYGLHLQIYSQIYKRDGEKVL